MRATDWPARFQRELLTYRRCSTPLGYMSAAVLGAFVCVSVPGIGSAAETEAPSPTTPCEKQAWPYGNKACSRDAANSASSRKIRVISTDRNAPATIVSPTPTLGEEVTLPPETQTAGAPPAPDPAPPTASIDPDQAPLPPPTERASVQPPPSPSGLDRERNSVRTITVSSSTSAAPRTDTVVVRVYRLANGRRITQYSNIPQATAGRPGQTARVFVVPTESAAEAYAYAPHYR